MLSRQKLSVLPNLFTAASFTCGLAAMAHMAAGDYIQACWLIVFAIVLDSCDGTVARLTRSQSAFGGQFDSLSDMCVFGVAPALLFYYLFSPVHQNAALLIMLAFALAAAVRLARFNVHHETGQQEKYFFQGLPTPAAAVGMVTLALFYLTTDSDLVWRAMPYLALMFAALMVSRFPYVSSKYFFRSTRLTLELLLVVTVYLWCLVTMKEAREYILLAGFSVYLASGFIVRAANWLHAQEEVVFDEDEEELEDFNGRL
ncbi:MAG: CDP-diacylglycerol--serine O-phosphatidyltransferase [Candidatus Sumerlaeia bacterium]